MCRKQFLKHTQEYAGRLFWPSIRFKPRHNLIFPRDKMKMILRENSICLFGVFIAVLLRICTSLHQYSGQGKPPMYGDYEAQRHWMEITVNLPVTEWYRNSTDNDLMYWGLDYPPLTAYHSYICGIIARIFNGDFVKLHESRGFESESHKLFMRYTVLISDLLVFIPAIVYYFNVTRTGKDDDKTRKKRLKIVKINFSFSVILALLYPGLILIDHGHFQYNCVSLGFAVFSVAFLRENRYILSSVFFCLALNYKQMELYHAFPFFLYLLSTCIPKPNKTILSGVFKLTKIAVSVILTFGLIWFPFVFSLNDFLQVIHRLFPVARGIFEDKVANVWCALNIFYKFKENYCVNEMFRLCMIVTLTAILPSSVDLFVRPNIEKFVLSLINSSLAFFLFSFQVHEKTILLVAVPVLLYFPEKPIACFWFLIISTFSMFPLFVKDNLMIACFALVIFYMVSFKLIYNLTYKPFNFNVKFRGFSRDFLDVFDSKLTLVDTVKKHWDFLRHFLGYSILITSVTLLVLLCFVMVIFEPPSRYPDLFPLLISVYSCVHFLGFFCYFNVAQLRLPQGFDDLKLKSA